MNENQILYGLLCSSPFPPNSVIEKFFDDTLKILNT